MIAWSGDVTKETKKEKLWYLASPYSHKDAWVRELRFRAVARIAGRLRAEHGLATFCPISHSHPISKEILGLVDPTDHDFWLSWDEPFERLCDELLVAKLPGWEESRGVNREIVQFDKVGKPVTMLNVHEWFTLTEWEMLKA